MMQFHLFDANFSAIAFPKPEVAPVINMIFSMPAKLQKQLYAGLDVKNSGGFDVPDVDYLIKTMVPFFIIFLPR